MAGRPVIPAEAVEAAAKALAIQAWGQWEYVPNELRKAFIRDAKITLEAAAPYMLAAAKADAWDEATKALVAAFASGERRLINPYRPAP